VHPLVGEELSQRRMLLKVEGTIFWVIAEKSPGAKLGHPGLASTVRFRSDWE